MFWYPQDNIQGSELPPEPLPPPCYWRRLHRGQLFCRLSLLQRRFLLRLFRIQLPAPVTVHCAVGVRTPPYSSGKRYCRSADAKCDEVTQAETFAPPLSTADAAIIRLCAIVEHAPYCPRYGIPNFISPKLDPMHWLSKSPAKTQSTSFACVFERSRAFSRASP